MAKLDTKTRQEIEKNIFSASHLAIKDWDRYPWHRHGKQITTGWPNSSQALSIEVFGTLKALQNQLARDAVMNALVVELGMESDHDWAIDLEWMDNRNRLNEPRRTQVDVKAQGQKNLILMECKFTEQDGGTCSQVKPFRKGVGKGKRQCDGAYRVQINSVNGQMGSCALTVKGIRYWDLIPEVFNFDRHQEYEECPFKGGWFQWMRNLVLCQELARQGLQPKVAIVYVDSPSMPFKRKMVGGELDKFLWTLKNKALLNTLSYQRILELGAEALSTFETERRVWEALGLHVHNKIKLVESRE